jgi:hypothetical protein
VQKTFAYNSECSREIAASSCGMRFMTAFALGAREGPSGFTEASILLTPIRLGMRAERALKALSLPWHYTCRRTRARFNGIALALVTVDVARIRTSGRRCLMKFDTAPDTPTLARAVACFSTADSFLEYLRNRES